MIHPSELLSIKETYWNIQPVFTVYITRQKPVLFVCLTVVRQWPGSTQRGFPDLYIYFAENRKPRNDVHDSCDTEP